MGLLNTPTMNAFWRRLEKPQQRAYHFCAEYQVTPGEMQIFDGVATSNVAVSSRTSTGASRPPLRAPCSRRGRRKKWFCGL